MTNEKYSYRDFTGQSTRDRKLVDIHWQPPKKAGQMGVFSHDGCPHGGHRLWCARSVMRTFSGKHGSSRWTLARDEWTQTEAAKIIEQCEHPTPSDLEGAMISIERRLLRQCLHAMQQGSPASPRLVEHVKEVIDNGG